MSKYLMEIPNFRYIILMISFKKIKQRKYNRGRLDPVLHNTKHVIITILQLE